MKTLDEVIESITTQSGLEIRNVRKPERDRFWVDRDTYNDALHYLKQYQRDKQIYSYDIARRNLEVAERNDPLSWDELKGMEGKPVWIETKYYSSRWAVITDVDDVRIRFVGKQLLDSEIVQEMGKTWQAYRKERKFE